MKSINPIQDLKRYIEIIQEKEPLIMNMNKLFFYSSTEIKWLRKFSSKTRWEYMTWYKSCKYLLGYNIIPDLKILNDLNSYCCQYDINPLYLLSRL